MTKQQNPDAPEFFESTPVDPVTSASKAGDRGSPGRPPSPVPKKKAGFYLSQEVIDRFDRNFYTLKLAGQAVENKSVLLEAALTYALDDLEAGEDSVILARLAGR